MHAVTPEVVLARFPALAGAGTDGVEALIDASALHRADAGEALVAEGTLSADLFLVLEGSLDITVNDRRVANVDPGAYFGEVSLLDPGPAGATIVTEQGCTVLRLSREGLETLREGSPAALGALVGDVLRSLLARARAASAIIAGPAAARVS